MLGAFFSGRNGGRTSGSVPPFVADLYHVFVAYTRCSVQFTVATARAFQVFSSIHTHACRLHQVEVEVLGCRKRAGLQVGTLEVGNFEVLLSDVLIGIPESEHRAASFPPANLFWVCGRSMYGEELKGDGVWRNLSQWHSGEMGVGWGRGSEWGAGWVG